MLSLSSYDKPTIIEPALLPIPKLPVAVRQAMLPDLPFIDSLQKLHTKQVGWMPMNQLEVKISAGMC